MVTFYQETSDSNAKISKLFRAWDVFLFQVRYCWIFGTIWNYTPVPLKMRDVRFSVLQKSSNKINFPATTTSSYPFKCSKLVTLHPTPFLQTSDFHIKAFKIPHTEWVFRFRGIHRDSMTPILYRTNVAI